MKKLRQQRARADPLAGGWTAVEKMLESAPIPETRVSFERLCEQHPRCCREGQWRVFQCRVTTGWTEGYAGGRERRERCKRVQHWQACEVRALTCREGGCMVEFPGQGDVAKW